MSKYRELAEELIAADVPLTREAAAAPELLAALKNMVSLASPYFTDGPQRVAISEARAAIAGKEKSNG